MPGPRKWLPSSLIFLLLSTIFSTVLVYSVPAEDPFVPSLPEIPPPRAENRESLYRQLMQQREDYPDQSAEILGRNSRSSDPEQRPEAAEPVLKKKAPQERTETKVEKVRPLPAAATSDIPAPRPETGIQKNEAKIAIPRPDDSDREKDQKRFQKEKDDIATRLSRDAAQNADEAYALSQKAQRNQKPEASESRLLHGIDPVDNRHYRYTAPAYYKGIYINNYVARTKSMYAPLLKKARASGVNTLVVDVQPSLPPEAFLKEAKAMGFYLVSRVVVFEGGLRTYPAPQAHVNKVLQRAEAAATLGFMEIQLDYIRFADKLHIRGLTLTRRYRAIAAILQAFEKRLRPHGVRIGADIFGRIPFNQNDIIGQKMEVFAPYLDTIYPMLYPSHFYGDPFYQKNPYRTIYDGKTKAIRRAGTSRVIAYIQGFTMYVGKSGLSYKDYIKKQILAARDSGGAGFIVWNPKNQYGTFFQALEETN